LWTAEACIVVVKGVASASWRERLYRWRWWIAAVAVLVVVRVALPEVLRRVIVSQASEALAERVDIGDVDLRLWRGGIALDDVAVREKGAPDPPPPPEDESENAPPPPFDRYSPIIGFKRLAVELHYLPLFSKTIQLRDVTIETPRVSLDRLGTGEFNVMQLVPQGDEEESPAPDDESTDWKLGLDKFVLKDGRIRFRDMTLEDSEPIEVGIDRISVDEIALTPALYGKPGAIALKLGIDEGTVDVTAKLALNGSIVNVTTDVTANRLPLRRTRLYVPNVGWSELRGELDLALTYELEAETTNALHGTIALRDVAVSVPSLEDAAVDWRSLTVDLERIDLLAQRAAVREITLDGAEVAVRVRGGGILPVLAQKAAAAPTTAQSTAAATPSIPAIQTPDTGSTPLPTERGSAAATASPTVEPEASETVPAEERPAPTTSAAVPATTSPSREKGAATVGAEQTVPTPTATPDDTRESDEEAPETPTDDAPAEPWGWQVTAVRVTDSKLRVLSDQPPLDVGFELATANLSGDADTIGHVTLGLAIEPGTVALDGDLRIAPVPAFGGTLKIVDLSLPSLPVVNSVLPPEAFPSGNLRSDLQITAGLPPPGGDEAPADQLRLGGTIGLAELTLSPPQVEGLTLELEDAELRIDQLAVPGVIPPGQSAAAGAAIDLAAGLTLHGPRVTLTGDEPLKFAAASVSLEIPSLAVPATLAGLGPGEGVPLVSGALRLELSDPRVDLGDGNLTVEAQDVALQVTDLTLPVLPLPAVVESEGELAAGKADQVDPSPAEAAAVVPVGAPDVTLALQLDLGKLKVGTVQGNELNAGAESIALTLSDVVVPDFVAGAPLMPSSEPLRASGRLQLIEPRVARANGKEMSISAKSIDVPLQSLALPGVPGGIPAGVTAPALSAVFGEIRLETPKIRVTRRKEGLVLPAFSASAEPQQVETSEAPVRAEASQPLELQIAAVRVRRGELDVTDRAVQPKFSTRFAPIEIDARKIKLPGPQVNPLNVDITSQEQGHITVRGNLAPDVSTLELKVDRLALAPFAPYATAYSPYSIADGALSIEMKATASGTKYDVKNDISLHQFAVAGTGEDSFFEENFGVSLSMALALLRDLQGDINLSVPMEVDRAGNAQVNVTAVVRSALRRALTGAITSPLKMLGAVVGGKGAPILPSPIAFRLGRAEPTSKGAKNAERLAAFLTGRPTMGVQLSSAATAADERWLYEQSLRSDFADENFFERSLAFLTKRGPRERIRAYLETRGRNKKATLSAEDTATLDEWLAERPAPTPQQLLALAEARLETVEKLLQAEGIDPSHISRGAPPEEPSKPTVDVKLRAQPVSDVE
jgi:uncharacterized protein involved in outer membrane biogenesis